MNSHQGNLLVVTSIICILVCKQRDIRQVVRQRDSRISLLDALLREIIDTIQQFDAFLDNINNSDLDVKVAPVKKVTKQVTVTKYVGE